MQIPDSRLRGNDDLWTRTVLSDAQTGQFPVSYEMQAWGKNKNTPKGVLMSREMALFRPQIIFIELAVGTQEIDQVFVSQIEDG